MTDFKISTKTEEYIKMHRYLKEKSIYFSDISFLSENVYKDLSKNNSAFDDFVNDEIKSKEYKNTKAWIEDYFSNTFPNYFSEISELTKHKWHFQHYFGLLSKYFFIGFSDPFYRRNKIVLGWDLDNADYAFIIAHELFHTHYFDYIRTHFSHDQTLYNKLYKSDAVEGTAYLVLFETQFKKYMREDLQKDQLSNFYKLPKAGELHDLFLKEKSFNDFLLKIGKLL